MENQHRENDDPRWPRYKGQGWISESWINGQAPFRIDPYVLWAEVTGYDYLNGKPVWTPLLIELKEKHKLGTASAFAKAVAELDFIRVPSVYLKPLGKDGDDSRFCTATVREEFFTALNGQLGALQAIERFEMSLPVISSADTTTTPPVADKISNTPTIAVIDDGLAFANAAFRSGTSTRVAYFWNQEPDPRDETNPDPHARRPTHGYKPLGLGYGSEIAKVKTSQAQGFVAGKPGIDDLLKAASNGGLIDEDFAYEHVATGTSRLPSNLSTRRRTSHGSHVMDLAAGSDAAHPIACPIIAVQLPSRTTRDTSGATLGVQVQDALRYIFDRAARNPDGANPPLVVNLSYGTIAGPHDGTSELEMAIDEAIRLRPAPLAVVLPAGNNHLSRCHARHTLQKNGTCTIRWRVLPDDKTPSSVQLWLPRMAQGKTARIEVVLVAPTGERSPVIKWGTAYKWVDANNQAIALVAYPGGATSLANDREAVFLFTRSTATESATRPVAPAGEWTIEVKNVQDPIDLDAWVQRDDTPYGYRIRGRQSRFVDSRYVTIDPVTTRVVEVDDGSAVQRQGTMSAIATGYASIVVGGYRRTDGRAALDSASGPICPSPANAKRTRTGPDAMLVSEDSAAHRSLLGSGTRSRSVFALSGTSVAAPQLTRILAGWLSVPGTAIDYNAVAAFAQAQEQKMPATSEVVPVERKGSGRIDLPARYSRRPESDPLRE